MEAAIETEIASFAAKGRREEQGETFETMCIHSIQESAERDINKLTGQLSGATTAAFEVEFAREKIEMLKSLLN